jgi:hypothetical protein
VVRPGQSLREVPDDEILLAREGEGPIETFNAWAEIFVTFVLGRASIMAKIAKTGDRKKVMDTNKSTDCPKCSKPTRIVKRVKDRERGTPGGVYISCSACDFFEKL